MRSPDRPTRRRTRRRRPQRRKHLALGHTGRVSSLQELRARRDQLTRRLIDAPPKPTNQVRAIRRRPATAATRARRRTPPARQLAARPLQPRPRRPAPAYLQTKRDPRADPPRWSRHRKAREPARRSPPTAPRSRTRRHGTKPVGARPLEVGRLDSGDARAVERSVWPRMSWRETPAARPLVIGRCRWRSRRRGA